MNVSVMAFCSDLADMLAAAAALERSSTPRRVWHGQAVEADAGDPYSVVAATGGAIGFVPVTQLSVQVMTVGTDLAAAMAQGQSLYEALLDASGRPVRMKAVGSYRLNAVDPRPPAALGTDARGRWRVAFNVDCDVVRVA